MLRVSLHGVHGGGGGEDGGDEGGASAHPGTYIRATRPANSLSTRPHHTRLLRAGAALEKAAFENLYA